MQSGQTSYGRTILRPSILAREVPISSSIPFPHSATAKTKLIIEQAIMAVRAGDAGDAEQSLRRHLLEAPHDVAVLAALSDLLSGQGRLLDASLLLKRALAGNPEAHSLRLALVRLLQAQGQMEPALAEVEQLPAAVREGFEVLAMEAALLGWLRRHDQEIAIYERMIQLQPDHPVLWMSYGNALKTVGRTDEAVRALRQAIKLRPTYGEAYWSLANLKTFRFEHRDLSAMQRALRSKSADEADVVRLHFALGKALEDRGDFKPSFHHYAEGNRIRSAQLSEAETRITPRVDAAIASFDRALMNRLVGAGDPGSGPIFIVGPQRSGSTLIEQILASHPLIEGTAELPILEQIWLRLGSPEGQRDSFAALAGLDPAALQQLGADYLQRARAYRRTDRPYFVDKLPANWLNAGFIRLILPNAKIIDARRHPMACGFSNFKQLYATGVTFSYSLETIGRFYADYLRLMHHFDQIMPGAVHHVINERLIDDPEGEVRRLLDFIGVPFDPACLAFHRTERAVHSASSEQVRQPLNRAGVDQWRHYESWLDPLKAALGEALDHWSE